MSSLLYNYKLTVAYDGTHYCGWQIQPNGLTIQECLQNAIKVILKVPVTVIGSGRTDAGVHASGQIAHFLCDRSLDLHRFLASLNGLLPYDIRVLKVEAAPLDFHAQYSAKSKTYHYHLFLDRFQDPFKRLYSYHVLGKVDLEALKKGAKEFVGTHDFTSFANESFAGSASKNPVRTLKRLDPLAEPGGVRLEFEADGFLYKMVRNIVGTLLEISFRKLNHQEIPLILKAKDRRQAGIAAPPHGLFLVDVEY